MGYQRVVPARTAKFWLTFVGIIIGASLLLFGISFLATSGSPAGLSNETQNHATGNASAKKVPDGPSIHDTLSKQKEYERN